MVVILYFLFEAYSINSLIGSPSRMFELLQEAAIKRPVVGNEGGSYLTLKSNYALVFGVIQLCSGSGTVFLDQAYWQRAIASRPTTAVRAYILGGLAWFAIPFGFATTLGLAAVALTDNPAFPTYPAAPTMTQISSGLAAPFGAITMLGTGGAVALLIVLFMAVTSCASAELIAVSSILTFDVYKTYIRPTAAPDSLIFVSHVMICVFGFVMALFACIWNAIGIDLGWLFLVMGLLIGGAVFPAAFAISWKGQTRAGAISGAVLGLVAGLIGWLTQAHTYYGELSIVTTGMEYPTLAGNLAAIITGLVVTVAVSLIWPGEAFDWESTRAINAAVLDASDTRQSSYTAKGTDSPPLEKEQNASDFDTNNEKAVHERPNENLQTVRDEEADLRAEATMEESPRSLRGAFKVACIASFLLTFIMDFLIPMPMFFTHYIFSQGFFTAWVVITFIWVFVSTVISVILPIWETAGFFRVLGKEIWADLRGRKG